MDLGLGPKSGHLCKKKNAGSNYFTGTIDKTQTGTIIILSLKNHLDESDPAPSVSIALPGPILRLPLCQTRPQIWPLFNDTFKLHVIYKVDSLLLKQ